MIDLNSFYAALDTSPSAMFFVKASGDILYANLAAQALFLYSLDEFKNMKIDELMPKKLRVEKHIQEIKGPDETGELTIETKKTFPAVRKDGRRLMVDAKITNIDYEGKSYQVYGLVDLTERQSIEEVIREQTNQLAKANFRLSHLAATDPLTGLKNRREMMLQLEALLVDATLKETSISLIMIDIDHFKAYNDAFGHLAGDDILRRFADLLELNAREEDVVARYGGEEFVLMFGDHEEEAVQIAERLRMLVENKVWPLRKVTISLGVICLYPHLEPGDIDSLMIKLIDQADKAMYYSKETGRNRVTNYAVLQETK